MEWLERKDQTITCLISPSNWQGMLRRRYPIQKAAIHEGRDFVFKPLSSFHKPPVNKIELDIHNVLH